MFEPAEAFNGFSVNDVDAAKAFYEQKLGCSVEDDVGGFFITLPTGRQIWAYLRPDHQPAPYTMLNFVVADINQAMDSLSASGIEFERYTGIDQDEQGVARGEDRGGGPNIAWFKDPAGNILSVLER